MDFASDNLMIFTCTFIMRILLIISVLNMAVQSFDSPFFLYKRYSNKRWHFGLCGKGFRE